MNTTSHTTPAAGSPVALHRLGQLLAAAEVKQSSPTRRRPGHGWTLAPRRPAVAHA